MLVTNVKVPAGGSIGVRRLIDTVPGSPINDNYFEVHTI